MPATGEQNRAMRNDERHLILQWLAHIDETDPAAISWVLAKCQGDGRERSGILKLASVILPPKTTPDERRTCQQCANLSSHRICLAGERGDLRIRRGYRPVYNIPMRCDSYQPLPEGDDPRFGTLQQKGVALGC